MGICDNVPESAAFICCCTSRPPAECAGLFTHHLTPRTSGSPPRTSPCDVPEPSQQTHAQATSLPSHEKGHCMQGPHLHPCVTGRQAASLDHCCPGPQVATTPLEPTLGRGAPNSCIARETVSRMDQRWPLSPLTCLLTRARLLPFPWTLGWPLNTLSQRKSGTQGTPPPSHPFQCARGVSEATMDQTGITSTSSRGPIDAYHMEQGSHPARPCPTSSPTKL